MNKWTLFFMLINIFINAKQKLLVLNNKTEEGSYKIMDASFSNVASNPKGCHGSGLLQCIMKINQIFNQASAETKKTLVKELKALEETLLNESKTLSQKFHQELIDLINNFSATFKTLIEMFQTEVTKQVTTTVIKNEKEAQSLIDNLNLATKTKINEEFDKLADPSSPSGPSIVVDKAKEVVSTEMDSLKTKLDEEFKKLEAKQSEDIMKVIQSNVTKLLEDIGQDFNLLKEGVALKMNDLNTSVKNKMSESIKKTLFSLEVSLKKILDQTKEKIINLVSN